MAKDIGSSFQSNTDLIYISSNVYNRHASYYSISRAGILQSTKSLKLKRNKAFNCNALFCIIDGKGLVKYEEKKYPIKPGQLAILGAEREYEFIADSKIGVSLCWLEFYGSDSIPLANRLLDGHGPIYDANSGNTLDSCIDLVSFIKAAKPLQISFKIYSILCELDRQRTNLLERQHDSSVNEELRDLLTYIDENLGEQLTLELLAKKALYNPTYLARKFAKIIGESPSKYILKKRVGRARELLILTDKTLEQISNELGFYDISHFISRFKEYEEVTPAEFRRQCRGLQVKNRIIKN